jgi:hypothetical protein
MQGAKERREAYRQYAARRSDRPSSVASYCGGWKGKTADDALMVDQGFVDTPGLFLYSPFAHEYDLSFMGLSFPSPWTPIIEAASRSAFFTHAEILPMVCKGARKR